MHRSIIRLTGIVAIVLLPIAFDAVGVLADDANPQDVPSASDDGTEKSKAASSSQRSEVWGYLITFASGGIFIKFLEIAYKEVDRFRSARQQTSAVVSRNLEPILKSADELLSRIRAWADREGCGRMGTHDSNSESLSPHLANTLYLFAHLWARLSVLRYENNSIDVAGNHKGRLLLQFIQTLESKAVQFIPRENQRLIGEALITRGEPKVRITSFYEFVSRYKDDEMFRETMAPLIHFVTHCNHTRHRQGALAIGILLHSLINTLDPKHNITRDRKPTLGGKISQRTRRVLRYKVYGHYLKDVQNPRLYTG